MPTPPFFARTTMSFKPEFRGPSLQLEMPLQLRITQCKPDQPFPSNLFITVKSLDRLDKGNLGILVPRPTECGDEFVHMWAENLGVEPNETWHDLVAEHAAQLEEHRKKRDRWTRDSS